jgi:hypothetical protein
LASLSWIGQSNLARRLHAEQHPGRTAFWNLIDIPKAIDLQNKEKGAQVDVEAVRYWHAIGEHVARHTPSILAIPDKEAMHLRHFIQGPFHLTTYPSILALSISLISIMISRYLRHT